MHFSYIFKHIKRSLATNILFCLLLALSGALISLSAAMWFSAHKGIVDIDDYFTTIALPETAAIRAYASNYAQRTGITEYTMLDGDTLVLEPDMLFTHEEIDGVIRTTGRRNPDSNQWYFNSMVNSDVEGRILNEINAFFRHGMFQTDNRKIIGVYSPELNTVPLRLTEASDWLRITMIHEMPQKKAAFIATCTKVNEELSVYSNPQNMLGMPEPLASESALATRWVTAEFDINEIVTLHEAYTRPSFIEATFNYVNPDGSNPVEEGRQYLIIGDLSIVRYSSTPSGLSRAEEGHFLRVSPLGAAHGWVKTGELEIPEGADFRDNFGNSIELAVGASSIPIYGSIAIKPENDTDSAYFGYAWYELDGTLEEALASPEGAYIENALNYARIASNSFTAIATDNIESLLRFNQKRARLTEGRYFSQAEYQNGAKVCLVTSHFAELNKLSLGDAIPLSFYPATLNGFGSGGWVPSSYNPIFGLTAEDMYTVVGVFDTLPFERNDHAISPNMVIIPYGSTPVFDESIIGWVLPESYPPIIYTYIIQNGELTQARDMINEYLGGNAIFFRYFDQGYTAVAHTMTNLRTGMAWILALTFIGWAASAAIFMAFFVGRKKQEMEILYALGVSKIRRFCWVFIQAAIIIIISQGIALAAVLPFYEDILDRAAVMVEEYTNPDRYAVFSDSEEAEGIRNPMPLFTYPNAMVLTTAAGALVLFVVSGFYIKRTVPLTPLN